MKLPKQTAPVQRFSYTSSTLSAQSGVEESGRRLTTPFDDILRLGNKLSASGDAARMIRL